MLQSSIYSKLSKINPFWIKDRTFAYNYHFAKAHDFGYDYVMDNNILYQLSFSTNAGKFTINADAMAIYEHNTNKLKYIKAYYSVTSYGYRYHNSQWKKATYANRNSHFFNYNSFYDIDKFLIRQENDLKKFNLETLCKEGLTFWYGANSQHSKPYIMSGLANLLTKDEFKVLQQKYFNKVLDLIIYRDYLLLTKNKPGYKKIETRYRYHHDLIVNEKKRRQEKKAKDLEKALKDVKNAIIRPKSNEDLKIIGGMLKNCIGTLNGQVPKNFYLVVLNKKKIAVELKNGKLKEMRYFQNAYVEKEMQQKVMEYIKATRSSKQSDIKTWIGEQNEI